MSIKSFNSFNEEKGNNWIKDAVKNKGGLRKSLNKKEGEKITQKEINNELKKLKAKDKDKSKEGIQGLSKSDLKKLRQLNLAKTLKGLKESKDYDNDNYMFFANLQHIVRMASEIMEMDESQIDEMLTDGHDWANDHISKSMESIEHVYNFLLSSLDEEGTQEEELDEMESELDEAQDELDETEKELDEMESELDEMEDEIEEKNVKSFNDFE